MATKKCTTCGKMKKMAVGGKTEDCPKGQVWDGTRCISNISPKIAAGILGAGVAALGTKIGMNIKENKPVRQAKRAAKKNSDLIAKRGGVVAKRAVTKKK
jgi:hypothetical protein